MPIEMVLVDADGVIQYAPEDWSRTFAHCLACGDPELEQQFAKDIYAAETACLSCLMQTGRRKTKRALL